MHLIGLKVLSDSKLAVYRVLALLWTPDYDGVVLIMFNIVVLSINY